MPKAKKVVYLCDGRGCTVMCADTKTPEEWAKYDCHHTHDEAHSKTKCRRKRRFRTFKDGEMVEIE